MTPFNNPLLFNSRLCRLHNLLFFIWVLACACNPNENKGIHIIWTDIKAKGIRIPEKMVPGIHRDSLASFVKIRLLHSSTDMLGEYGFTDGIVFEPLIPFTRGSAYEVFYKQKSIGQFKVPVADGSDAPQLLAIYPQQDTLPENLLKIYLQFSHPMREGLSDQYIKLITNETDTLHDVFLNLQPELWNEDRTVITLWLDPGRIKRDLQPNLRLGAPLKQTGNYQLLVSNQWQNVEGLALQKDYTKQLMVGKRDSLSPDPAQWKIQTPKAGSRTALIIDFPEPLDHFLLLESMQISGNDGSLIKGKFFVEKRDTQCRFIPAASWVQGDYQLIIESRLEDLSGNNLNRPFDRDITQTKATETKNNYRLNFQVTH